MRYLIHTVMLEHFSFPSFAGWLCLEFCELHWLAGMVLEHSPLPPLGGFASSFNVFRCVVDVRLTFTRVVVLEYSSFSLFSCADSALGWWGQV